MNIKSQSILRSNLNVLDINLKKIKYNNYNQINSNNIEVKVEILYRFNKILKNEIEMYKEDLNLDEKNLYNIKNDCLKLNSENNNEPNIIHFNKNNWFNTLLDNFNNIVKNIYEYNKNQIENKQSLIEIYNNLKIDITELEKDIQFLNKIKLNLISDNVKDSIKTDKNNLICLEKEKLRNLEEIYFINENNSLKNVLNERNKIKLIDLISEEINKKKSVLDSLNKDKELKDSELNFINKNKEKIKEKFEKVFEENTELNDNLKNIKKKIKNYKKIIKNIKYDIEFYDKEISIDEEKKFNKIQNNILLISNKNKILKNDIHNIKLEKMNLEYNINDKKDINRDLESKLKCLNEEITSLKKKYDDKNELIKQFKTSEPKFHSSLLNEKNILLNKIKDFKNKKLDIINVKSYKDKIYNKESEYIKNKSNLDCYFKLELDKINYDISLIQTNYNKEFEKRKLLKEELINLNENNQDPQEYNKYNKFNMTIILLKSQLRSKENIISKLNSNNSENVISILKDNFNLNLNNNKKYYNFIQKKLSNYNKNNNGDYENIDKTHWFNENINDKVDLKLDQLKSEKTFLINNLAKKKENLIRISQVHNSTWNSLNSIKNSLIMQYNKNLDNKKFKIQKIIDMINQY